MVPGWVGSNPQVSWRPAFARKLKQVRFLFTIFFKLCPCGGMVDTPVSNAGSARSESSNLSGGTCTWLIDGLESHTVNSRPVETPVMLG